MVQENKDFDMPYPLKKDLRIDEGRLTEGKGKVTHFLFKLENGTVFSLHPSGVFDFLKTEWFRSESDQPVWREAKVAWFKMPSGDGWIAELELDGKLLAGYEQRKHDFNQRKSFIDHHLFSRAIKLSAQYLYYIGIGVILLAYLVSWFQLRRKAFINNGTLARPDHKSQ